MSTDVSEIEALHRFIGEQLESGVSQMTAEEGLRAFQEHQREVEKLREHLKKSEGDEGHELDADALKNRVRDRLAEQGVTE